jgi:flagellar motor switch protein FliM
MSAAALSPVQPRVLLASPTPEFRERMRDSLTDPSCRIQEAVGGADALVKLENGNDWQLLMLDRRLPDLNAEELTAIINRRYPGIRVVVVDSETLPCAGQSFTERQSEQSEPCKKGLPEIEPLPGMVGWAESMQRLYRMVRLVAPRLTTVLITGATGTGKELVARALHELSPRVRRPFVVVNCAAIPEALLEAELFGYLRIQFAATLASTEHLGYGEFLNSVPEVTYLATCRLLPVEAQALFQLDLAVAFPLIDVLLGGEGKSPAPARELTDIEEQILETVMRIICRELQTAWQSLSLEFRFEQRQQLGQVQQLMGTAEKTLLLSFEINVLESRGTLNVAVPAIVSNELLRKVTRAGMAKPRVRPESGRRLRARMLESRFESELCLVELRIPVGDLSAMAKGSVLSLHRKLSEPAVLQVGTHQLFNALPARSGLQRAAHLLSRIAPSSEKVE